MEGLTLQVEIIPSLVEATWHVQAVSWNLHVDYKLAINSLVFFSKIPCFCHQLPPTASFPGLIIAITVHLWHLLCRIHRIKVASYTGMAKNHFAAACFSYFILTMYRYIYIYIYIYNAYANTYIYIYIYIYIHIYIYTYTYVHKWINLYQDAIHDNRESHHHLLHHQWWNRSLHMTLFW